MMSCKKCGAELADNATTCPTCQAAVTSAATQQIPANYLAMSIIVTILCCWPLGIPAIVYAAQVNSKFAVGDYEGACQASKKAKMWCWITFAAGLISMLISALLYFLLIVAAATSQN